MTVNIELYIGPFPFDGRLVLEFWVSESGAGFLAEEVRDLAWSFMTYTVTMKSKFN